MTIRRRRHLLGDPDLTNAINNGLVLFVGGAPAGSTQAGTERISRNKLSYINGDVIRADPDNSGWVIPETTTINGTMYVTRPAIWDTTVGANYALWMDVIIDAADNFGTIISIPWRDVWGPHRTS